MALPQLTAPLQVVSMSYDMYLLYDVPVPFPGVAVIAQILGHITVAEAEAQMAAQKAAFDIDMDLSNFFVAKWYDVGYYLDPRDGIITYHQEVLPWHKLAANGPTPGMHIPPKNVPTAPPPEGNQFGV